MPNVIETTEVGSGTGTTYSLGIGQSAQGRINFLGDADWYRVELVAGHTYTFAVAGEGALSANVDDPFLYLRNSAGGLIASDDDSGPGRYSTLAYNATTTGTYYLDVEAWNNSSTGQYGLSIVEASRASYDADMGSGALLASGVSWAASPASATTITYGFRQTAPSYSTNGHPTTQSSFTQLTAAEMAAAQATMQLWSEFSGAQFTAVNPEGYTNNATILFGNYYDPNDGAGAFAYYPSSGQTGGTSPAGDVFLNTSSVSTSSLPFGSYSFFAVMHEVGHALGLDHPGDYNAAPGQSITYANSAQFMQDTHQYSIMSYFDEANTGAQYSSYPDTPMLFDVYALQQLYGINTTTRTGDTVYGFGSTAGSVYDFASNATPALCIWDAGGIDTLNCSGFSQAQIINLNAGMFSNIGGLLSNVAIAIGALIENAVGGSNNDTLTGNAANNSLDGRSGADSMSGGAGDDSYYVDNVSDTVTENLNEGTDTVYVTIHYRLTANFENLILQGSAELQAYGNALANLIYGNSAANILDGEAGADTMWGGAGNDSYFVDHAGDRPIENAGEGIDNVYSTAHLRLGANVENLILQGSADLQGYGNELSNFILGTAGDNLLNGEGGVDSMYGGAGNDSYFVDNISDVLVENVNEGFDTVYSTANLRLTANLENLVLLGSAVQGYGNELSNSIHGTSADNLLSGGGGVDATYGGTGNDSYFVENPGDQVVENANEGNDTVYSTAHLRLAANVETLILQGSVDLQGYGNSQANVLYGNLGNNLLEGGSGADTLFGGAGNDVFMFYRGEANGDRVLDFDGQGAAAGDRLMFYDYGAGATFTNIDATRWQVAYDGGASNELITFTNAASIHASDYAFA